MKKLFWLTFIILPIVVLAQKNKSVPSENNTLLWRITGKGLQRPSYLFGTMHMLCADDIELSDSLKYAIKNADQVYLELNMDNLMEMMGAMTHMSMRNDTTLSQLLTTSEYSKVKNYFNEHSSMIPFSMIETLKPLLAAATFMEQSAGCDHVVAMEELIMHEAKKNEKEIKGLETMEYQLSIFDSIPYALQAKQLVEMVDHAGGKDDDEMNNLTQAYRNQELSKMEDLTKDDMGMKNYTALLLYNRNINWAHKLEDLLSRNVLVIAVGAGHLPGEKGVINLLRKEGYKVEPVKNNMIKSKTKEI